MKQILLLKVEVQMRNKSLVCNIFIILCIFCSGCAINNNKEKSHLYEIKATHTYGNTSETYHIYTNGNKWRQEEFENNNLKPHTIKVFDGKVVYIRSAYSGIQGYRYPEKMKYATNNLKNITPDEGR
ncbi:hypothetical protein IJ670_07950, partial [bacterium]|nr:hypothetical protein [bacterium]